MTKTPEQQQILNHIWHELHEKQRNSQEAATLAKIYRQQEKNPNSEMALELAAMEFVTNLAAAKDAKFYKDAYPFLVQAAQVAQETFPLAENVDTARERGNSWDKVYGQQNAQLAVLRNYFHFIQRLKYLRPTEEFQNYAHNLWITFLQIINELADDLSTQILIIEHGEYEEAKHSFEKFLENLALEPAHLNHTITVSARMMNRSLQEHDFETALKAFRSMLSALKANPKQLMHFVRQLAANSLINKNLAQRKKLESWQEEAQSKNLSEFKQLLRLTFIGLGHDQVTQINEAL